MPLLQIHDIAILKARPPLPARPAPADLELRELFQDQTAEIIAGHNRLGRRTPPERIQRRFKHGLRFFELWRSGVLTGSTWAASGSARYIDELAWALPLQPHEIWLRDVFISPDARGSRLFTHMTSLMARAANPNCTTIWSDVDWSNHASMRAHTAAGFEIWKRSRALVIVDRLLLRSHIRDWHLPIDQLAPQQRALWLTKARREQHASLIA